MSHQNRWLLGHLLSSTAIVGASALGLTLAASANKAFAACDIANPTEGQTVTCSAGDNTGVYAADGERNITVNLEAGASITPPASTTPIDLNGSSSVNDASISAGKGGGLVGFSSAFSVSYEGRKADYFTDFQTNPNGSIALSEAGAINLSLSNTEVTGVDYAAGI
jgi:hypothetical protein